MQHLAKGGFTQSYSYFTWRNTKCGADRVLHRADPDRRRPSTCGRTCSPTRPTSSTSTSRRRPAGVPDPAGPGRDPGGDLRHLRPAVRAVRRRRRCGRARRSTSTREKYQVRHWDLDRPGRLRDFIARINAIRRENPALHYDRNLRFFDDRQRADHLLRQGHARPVEHHPGASSTSTRTTPSRAGCGCPLASSGWTPGDSYQVHDLITEARYLWHGESNFVQLDPQVTGAHILRLRRKLRTERDFDYFM